MTVPAAGGPAGAAVVGGVDVDAVAAAVCACAGVAGLDGGTYHEVATYLPGRTVDGVVVDGGRVRVQIRAAWGARVPQLAARIRKALAPLTGRRPVDVLVADIGDPPGQPPGGQAPPGPAGRPGPSPGLPPG